MLSGTRNWVWCSFVPSHTLQNFYNFPLISIPFFFRASPEPLSVIWLTLLTVCLRMWCMITWRAKLICTYSQPPIRVPHPCMHTCDLQTFSMGHYMAEAANSAKSTLQLHHLLPSHLITFMPCCLVCPVHGVLCVRGQGVWPSCFVRIRVVLNYIKWFSVELVQPGFNSGCSI